MLTAHLGNWELGGAVMLGDPGLAEHEWFRNHAARAEHAKEFDDQFMDPWFRERTCEEIVQKGQEAGMPFSYPIPTSALCEDSQLVAREFFQTLDHPAAGSLAYPTSCVRPNGVRMAISRAPLLGEHSEQILCGELGYSAEELEALRRNEVV